MKKEEEKPKKKLTTKIKIFFIKIFVFLVVIIALVCLYSKKIEVNKLIVKEYKIESKNIPQNFDGIKIVHFSDLNYGSTVFESDLKKIVNQINKVNPDLVIFTGNLFYKNYEYTKEDIELIVSYFKQIDSEIGKYAVKGQYDYDIENLNIEFTNCGFKILENDYDLIYYKGLVPIFIGGLSSYLTTKIDLDSTLKYFDTEKEDKYAATYKIIISNESDVVDEILNREEQIDLILVGNSLGGSFRLPYLEPIFKEEGSKNYSSDYYNIDGTKIYVSSGLGTNNFKMRFLNKPSFNFYRLSTKK